MEEKLKVMAVVFSAVTAAFLLGAWAVKFVNIKLPAEKKYCHGLRHSKSKKER